MIVEKVYKWSLFVFFMEGETFAIQGQPCYVRVTGSSDGHVSYIVGTYGSPESPVSVRLAGLDSAFLRLRAVEQGLSEILEGQTYN